MTREGERGRERLEEKVFEGRLIRPGGYRRWEA